MLRDETLRVTLEDDGFFAGMIKTDFVMRAEQSIRAWIPILKKMLG